jgi:hypothetical protein
MNNIVNNFVLELHVPNFATAKEFYAIFGFSKLHYDPTSGGGSDLGYMVLKREDTIGRTLINFYGDDERVCEHSFFKDFPTNTRRGYEVEITIPVSDVDGLWDSIKDKMRLDQIAQSLKMKRWNKKDFRVIDPFGFYVRFTELVDWGQ